MKKVLTYISAAVVLLALAVPAFAELQINSALDVSGTKATAGDSSAKVQWDAVNYKTGTLKGYVVWYGTDSVSEDGGSYPNRVPATGDLGNVTSYTVPSLTNGTKYYFSVTAVDSNGVESENWSTPEASATPTKSNGGGGMITGSGSSSRSSSSSNSDKEPPQVVDAEAVDKEDVKVVFSEEVVLPKENPENAFVIENSDTFETLVVKEAKMDEEDKTNKTVLLSTDTQVKDANYKLTVSIDVTDTAGNPIRSDTSATAPFTGSDAKKVVADATAPKLVSVEAVDGTHFMVNFDKKIVLGVDPSKNFEVTAGKDSLAVTGVTLGNNKAGVADASAIVTTSAQKAVDYTVTVKGLKDADGNVISGIVGGTFKGIAGADTGSAGQAAAPKDVAKILAKKLLEAEKYTVTLSWTAPAENVGKVIEQLLYKSLDKGKDYTKETSLAADATTYELKDLDPGEYWFKLTQKDAAGNESKGTIVKVVLAKTGPEMIGLLLGSLVMGKVVSKKKKK